MVTKPWIEGAGVYRTRASDILQSDEARHQMEILKKSGLGLRLRKLRRQYIEQGGVLLSREQILEELKQYG